MRKIKKALEGNSLKKHDIFQHAGILKTMRSKIFCNENVNIDNARLNNENVCDDKLVLIHEDI